MIIRWVCKACDKKWIYPVEKCVYCKGDITKQKGSKLKVVGMTKVSIPSPMHPLIPYNIILLEDEFGNRMPKKTMKDYAIGSAYEEKKARTNDAVSIVKVKYDIYEAIKGAVELLNSVDFKSGEKILIKPSVISAAYPYQAVNTNPDFLNAMLKFLFEKGISKEDIIVAEQSLIGSDSMDAASKAGILEVCKQNGVQFIDISKGPFEEIESNGFKFNILKEALKRRIINAPIMKTNFQLGISGAMENLSRLVDEDTQRKMYFNNIEATLPKLANVFQNAVTVADATNGMQGQGPLALGEPAFLNLVLASKNAASLDKSFCEIAMLPIPKYVNDATTGKNNEIVGNEIEALKYPIKQPVHDETAHPDIKVIDGKACPACLNMMYNLTSKLVGLRGHQINLVMGSLISDDVLEGKERLVVLGDCAINKLGSKIKSTATIRENLDELEQLVLLKKLLTTEGTPKITTVDKVKSKMKKLLSKGVR